MKIDRVNYIIRILICTIFTVLLHPLSFIDTLVLCIAINAGLDIVGLLPFWSKSS